MSTSTLLLPAELSELELATFLDRKFGASWFPDLHRWSVEGGGATVYIDFVGDHVSGAPDHEIALVFGRRSDPVTGPAIHIQASPYHPDSTRLAAEVAHAVSGMIPDRLTNSPTATRLASSMR